MYLSMNWIGDYVDLSGLDRKALIRNFTLSTAEVEDICVKGGDTYGVIVAKILSVDPHPASKKLHLLKVDTGTDVLDIVCGAPNVRVGMKVALATAGGCVCGQKIEVATVAGYPSYGMCCGEAELGISDDRSGLFEITDDVPLGTDIKTVYDLDDIIFEVDNKSLTNRPDLWGHYGIAREFATITGRPLRPLDLLDTDRFADLAPVAVNVKATDLVYRYTALKVADIRRRVSPVNMRIRLFYCGSRAINFLADLTNYVMMELGQPMHAFDNKKVDKIEVQTFPGESAFTTLDGISRRIDDKTLMITSDDQPVAIAGIMGGDASKIEDDTDSLLLESATFDGVCVRKTSSRLGLRTDASMRYEKMLDPELCRTATERLLRLLLTFDPEAKVVSSFTDCYVRRYPVITLDFDKSYVDRYTGIDIPEETIEKTLTGLGFAVRKKNGGFSVTVPSWRATKDVTIKADIIEEITRIYGYDNFDIHTSKNALHPVRGETQKTEEDRMKDLLVSAFCMHEVHSYIWSDIAKNKELGIKTPENVRIINAQTPDHRFLRISMIPTLLSFVRDNRGFADSFSLFEIGHTVEGKKENGYCNEKKKLGAVLFSRTESEETLFFRARDAVRALCLNILHRSPRFVSAEAAFDFEHPKNTFSVLVGDVTVGYLSVAYPTVAAAIDKKAAVSFFEIDTGAFASVSAAPIRYTEPPKFPAIDIDLTFTADLETVDFDHLLSVAKTASPDLLTDVKVHDIFPLGSLAALTLRFTFVSAERTLTKAELSEESNAITDAFRTCGLSLKA